MRARRQRLRAAAPLAAVTILAALIVSGCAGSYTQPATEVGATNATVEGLVFDFDDATVTYWFEYGPTTDYGSATAHETISISDRDNHAVSADISGLEPETQYHYRLCATDDVHDYVFCANDRTFSTSEPENEGRVEMVSAGGYHTCAIRSDDSIACWGDDSNGEATPPSGSFKAVSAGAYHTCAIRSDDSIACWGSDINGEATPPAGSFKAVSAGFAHTCAIRSDDSIACWGRDTSGQATPPSGSFKAVSAGSSHTCAIRSDDSIACWGSNGNGQATPPSGSFKAVSAGGGDTCGVDNAQRIWCWGQTARQPLTTG